MQFAVVGRLLGIANPEPRVPQPTRARTHKQRRPIPGAAARDERLLAMVTGLAAEVAVTRERLDTVERLLDAGKVLAREQIESFRPDEAAAGERDALRRRVIGAVLRPVREAAERAATEQEQER